MEIEHSACPIGIVYVKQSISVYEFIKKYKKI